MYNESRNKARGREGTLSAFSVPAFTKNTLCKKDGARCCTKKQCHAMVVAVSLIAFLSLSLAADGCRPDSIIDREELTGTMHELHEAMRKALSMDPYSWPEYQAYLASDTEDYELISKRVEEAYAAYDEVLSYVDGYDADIEKSNSAETLKEVEILRNYVCLSVDYAYIVFNLFFNEIRIKRLHGEKYSQSIVEALEYMSNSLVSKYWSSFVDEYNRLCEKNGLEERLEY